MTAWVHRNLIVRAEHVQLARDLCRAIAGPQAQAGMFSAPLSPTGAAPATHYASVGLIDADFAALLPPPDHSSEIAALALQAGMTVSQSEIAEMLAASDVSEGSPWDAMARLGLQMVQGGAS